MNFWRKILTIAVVVVFAGNTEGMAPVLDFNNITAHVPGGVPPWFHPYSYAAPGIGQLPVAHLHNGVNYVYFNINPAPGNIGGAVIAPAANLAINRAPVNGEQNIYFPADGSQPTTPDAVSYSLANIDNGENSPITEWYMMMFGVIDKNGGNSNNGNDYIKAGWKYITPFGVSLRTRIISFDTSVDNTMVNGPNIPGATISRRALFIREFRKIASTSVGRTLLYRILIEIRRCVGAKGDVGNDVRIGSPSLCLDRYISSRNRMRQLVILVTPSKPLEFDPFQRMLIFNYNDIPSAQSICDSTNGFDYIVVHTTTIDTCLFHELLHWYHFLRNPLRYRNSLQEGSNLFCSFIGYYCWSGLSGSIPNNTDIKDVDEKSLRDYGCDLSREKVSAAAWSSPLNGIKWVDTEELETVLGNIVDEAKPVILKKPGFYDHEVLNGSDLSENLYRICIGVPLRFGYDSYSFYEDSLVIDKILTLYGVLEKYYICNVRNRRVNRERLIDLKHGKDYLKHWIKGIYKSGLGKCRA